MPFGYKIHIFLCVVLLCVLAGVCGPVSAFDFYYTYPGEDDLVIAPADYEIVPIDDGIEGVTITGLLNLVYWKTVLPIYIGSYFDFFEPTPLGNMTSTILVPFLSTIFGICGTFVIFCRRKSPEKIRNQRRQRSSPTFGSTNSARKNRSSTGWKVPGGSVAYQLHRLQIEQKIFAAECRRGSLPALISDFFGRFPAAEDDEGTADTKDRRKKRNQYCAGHVSKRRWFKEIKV